MKIKFKSSTTEFFKELNAQVSTMLTPKIIEKSKRRIKMKFFFYVIAYLTLYASLYLDVVSSNFWMLALSYTLLGLTGILLAFNGSHDAVHGTLFAKKLPNKIAHYLIFSFQGVNGTLWKKRHVSSHHIFPNVDGCDADIDDNPFLRLSKAHPRKKAHKFQHLYAPLLYCVYTLHWIFIKDFMYLSKKEVANMKNLSYSPKFIFEVIALKVLYLVVLLVLPFAVSGVSIWSFLAAFFIMHAVTSIFFVLALIISHLTKETSFPSADSEGFLPTCFHEHQLAVSLDYHPTSKLANWIFGGFNAHAAHHLFPKLPHTVYTMITPSIQELASKFSMPYNELSITQAIRSHFGYLKELGRA